MAFQTCRRSSRWSLLPSISKLHASSVAKSTFPCKATDGYTLVHAKEQPIMPALGFGTWGCDHFSHDLLARSVDCALRVGYRHLDCARVYANEKEIGAVIHDHLSAKTCSRSDLFITSKLFNNEHAPPNTNVSASLESTLKDFNLDYVDSFMIHWPFRNSPHSSPVPFDIDSWFLTYKLICELMDQGLTKSVGVCNATIHKMKQLLALCEENNVPKPTNLQIELHPYLQQDNVLQYCKDNDIAVTAAMPLGSPERPPRFRRDDDPVIMQDEELKKISQETGYSVPQVIIRWHLQKGVVCIPKGTEDWMIEENFKTLDFSLTEQQMSRINALDKHFRFARGENMAWKEDQPWQEMFDYE